MPADEGLRPTARTPDGQFGPGGPEMSTATALSRIVREAGDGICAFARYALSMLGLGTIVLVCTPLESRADSNSEWLAAAFSKPVAQRRFEPPRKLGAYLPERERPRRKKSKGVRVASLGPTPVPSMPSGSVSGGGKVRWVAKADCLAPSLRAVINHVAANFGSVRVNSTCRSRAHNRRVGGARRSYHLTGSAADFRVFGNVKATLAYLRTAVGGLKHYGGGLFHIDTGPRRRM